MFTIDCTRHSIIALLGFGLHLFALPLIKIHAEPDYLSDIYILQISYKQKFKSHIKKLEDANREKDFTIQQLQATINSLMVNIMKSST